LAAGRPAAGCGDNRADNPAPDDPLTNTDPSVGPALATNVQLDLPYDVAFEPVSAGGGLVFITDVGNRRVLALNVARFAVAIGPATVPPDCVMAFAGTEAGTPPGGTIGNPATSLSLCGPAATTMIGAVLAFTDNCSPPTPTKTSIILADVALGAGAARWTSLLGRDYRDPDMVGQFPGGGGPLGIDSLTLSGSLGLTWGGPNWSLYVTDFVNRGVYEVTGQPFPPEVPVFTATTWDPVAAPDLGEAMARAVVSSVPASPDFLARQRAYLQVKETKLQEWRAAGLPEADIAVLVAELKRQMLGR
jgi:hypothetical protein